MITPNLYINISLFGSSLSQSCDSNIIFIKVLIKIMMSNEIIIYDNNFAYNRLSIVAKKY